MERKLATIQTISNLEPIPNADRIEVATILGWKCVVKKGDFKIDDSVVYFEIDSFLPIKPDFEFLRENCYKKFEDGREGFRIKTRRMRGQFSQGLVMKRCIVCGAKMYDGKDGILYICENHYKPNKTGEEWAIFLQELCQEAINHKVEEKQ